LNPSPKRPAPLGSRLAAATLVVIALASPWAFGAVAPRALLLVIAVGLLAVAAALALGVARGRGADLALPALTRWPLLAFVALALAQLLPLPDAVHRRLAPGSFSVWRPSEPAARAVLGEAARPVSIDPQTTLRGAALVAALGLLALLSAPALAERRGATLALGALGACGLGLSAYAILARDRFGPLLYGTLPVPTVRPFGPFVNENHFAGWTSMAALLVAGLAAGLADAVRQRGRDWTAGRRAAPVVFAVVASLAMALGVLASHSRGGALALLVGTVCLLALVLSRPGGRPTAIAASVSLVLLLGLAVVSLAPASARERLLSASGASFRLDTWRDALRLAATSPLLGHGLGAFHDAYPRFKQGYASVRVEHAENDYMETLAETGVVGLFAALVALVVLFRAVAGRARGERSPLVLGAGRGAMAALAALAVHSAFDFDLRIPSNAALGALAVAMAVASVGGSARALGRGPAAALALGALLLLASVLTLPERPWRAAREEARRALAAPEGPVRTLRLLRAEAALVALLRARPGHAESWLMLAAVRRASGDPSTAAALARRALWLDPGRLGLREAALPLTAAAGDR